MAEKKQVTDEAATPLLTPLNVYALAAAVLAFMLTKKYGQPLLDKAQAALPK